MVCMTLISSLHHDNLLLTCLANKGTQRMWKVELSHSTPILMIGMPRLQECSHLLSNPPAELPVRNVMAS